MFSSPYKDVPYFGLWAEETAEIFGRRDALIVLRTAAERCAEEDMRTDDVEAALNYLKRFTTRHYHFKRFRRALDVQDAQDRVNCVANAYDSICGLLGVNLAN